MRSLRLFLCFLVGFGLSTVSLLSFAQLHEWTGSRTSPGSIYTRGPNGLPFNVDTGRYVGLDSASDGGATLRGRYSGSLAGRSLAIQSAQVVSGSALANIGKGLVRTVGPAALALTLAPLIWDEIQEDFFTESIPEGSTRTSYRGNERWRYSGKPYVSSAEAACGSAWPGSKAVNPSSDTFGPYRYECLTTSFGYQGQVDRAFYCVHSKSYSGSPICTPPVSCPEGQIFTSTGACSTAQRNPVSDADLGDAIYVELVSRGMGSELARRLISAGYEPQVLGAAPPVELSGPSSLQGGTTTSTTSGPSGQTTTDTTTNYDISYDGDTVTVTETTTSTTTRPDGQTETTTETKTPAPGHSDDGNKEPTEEPKPFCELYPQASACQELGESSDEDLGEEERSLGWALPNDVSAQCPQPRVFTSVTVGKSWNLEWAPVCEAAEAVKPVVVAFGLLSAAVFVFGIARARA